MGEYIGLDVSLKETAISVRRDGKRIWRDKCPSDPTLIAEVLRKRAPAAQRVVFETRPLAVWFYHALSAEGLPAICIDARHAKAALDTRAIATIPLRRPTWPRSAPQLWRDGDQPEAMRLVSVIERPGERKFKILGRRQRGALPRAS
jgi:transposase